MKNKYSYIGFTIVVLLFSIYVIRNWNHHKNTKSTSLNYQKINLPDASGLRYLVINNKARKMPDFTFTNQNNLIISNIDYANKVYVVEFFFTSCPTICPVMNRNMLTLEKEFGVRDDFGIASFTINPSYDTPMVLKQYAENYGVSSLNWHFLTGKQELIYEMANKGLNIFAGINPEVAGGFEHQGFFALIDKNGYLRSRVDPYGNPKIFYQGTAKEEIKLLSEDINLLLNE